MNDPNGLVYHNGKYHLFYQYYPNDIVWGPMHWGHAESADLLHWKHLPIALYPDSLGWIFSGSAVIDKDNTAGFGQNAMIAIFTYHNDEIWKAGRKNTESQGIAYSLDEGKTWMKFKGNPVLNNSGEQDFRDPKVFWNDKVSRWTMVLAAGDRIKLYSSSDLKEWRHDSDFIPAVAEEYGVWECPDLFPLKAGREEKWVMILSHNKNGANGGSATRYLIGDFDGKVFTPLPIAIGTTTQWVDWGMDYYAAVTFGNVPDKRILLGWMSNWEYATKTPTSNWRSAMALPRELTLVKKGNSFELKQSIVDLTSIQIPIMDKKKTLTAFEHGLQDAGQFLVTEATYEFEIDPASEDFTIVLTNYANDSLTITYQIGQLVLDRSRSGKTDFSPEFAKKPQTMTLNDRIEHILLIIDLSSIEIGVNHGAQWMTAQVFPTYHWSQFSFRGGKKFKIKTEKLFVLRNVWTE